METPVGWFLPKQNGELNHSCATGNSYRDTQRCRRVQSMADQKIGSHYWVVWTPWIAWKSSHHPKWWKTQENHSNHQPDSDYHGKTLEMLVVIIYPIIESLYIYIYRYSSEFPSFTTLYYMMFHYMYMFHMEVSHQLGSPLNPPCLFGIFPEITHPAKKGISPSASHPRRRRVGSQLGAPLDEMGGCFLGKFSRGVEL